MNNKEVNPMNFLQRHYNLYRDAGGDHAYYVVGNDIEDDLAEELKVNYENVKEKERKFMSKLKKIE